MMIYKNGNILDAPERVIVHGCNAQGVMRSGVAKAIRGRYPQAYTDYRRVYDDNGGLFLGQIIWSDNDPHMIVNAITQQYYGRDGRRYVDYDAITSAFTQIADTLSNWSGDKSVAIPRIGAGLGGGDWEEISQRIEIAMNPLPVIVYDFG